MKKASYIIFILSILSIVIFVNGDVLGFSNKRTATPIFDGNVLNGKYKLTLEDCTAYDLTPDDRKEVLYLGSKFKSKKWTYIEETWSDPLVVIKRYYFTCQEDALNFAYYASGSLPFKGWSQTHDIGDKTGWRTNDSLFFVKGKILVFIQVNPPSLGREFVRNVAESIEKKL